MTLETSGTEEEWMDKAGLALAKLPKLVFVSKSSLANEPVHKPCRTRSVSLWWDVQARTRKIIGK